MLSRPTRFSIDKAERDLGWRPEIPVREGLEDALDWVQVAAKSRPALRKSLSE